MQRSKILTIIVPTYNMERYLSFCLDSLLVTNHFNELEVLVINDGSKDASSAIAHQYEEKYPQVFRVVDKENGNYGSCVNVGLSMATGVYVKVLDADDSFQTANFEKFLDFLHTVNVDLILSDFAVVDTQRVVRKVIHYDLGEGGAFKMSEVCNTHRFKGMQMHAVTYKRELLLSINYKQSEGIFYTDIEWITLPMIAVRSVSHFAEYVYCYQVGREGQSVCGAVKQRSMSHVYTSVLHIMEYLEENRTRVIGQPVQEYLYTRLIPFVKEFYIFMLTHYRQKEQNLLREYDLAIKKRNRDFYEHIGKREVSSFGGFEYIKYWRQHPALPPLLIKMLSKAYVVFLCLKKRNKVDVMDIPSLK